MYISPSGWEIQFLLLKRGDSLAIAPIVPADHICVSGENYPHPNNSPVAAELHLPVIYLMRGNFSARWGVSIIYSRGIIPHPLHRNR